MPAGAIISGFTLGLIGSFHCIGMCGPLSLALPIRNNGMAARAGLLFAYQSGRITTYATLGLIVGLVGRRIYLQGYQQWLSICLGVLVLVLALLYFLNRYTFHVPFFRKFYSSLHILLIKLLKKGSSVPGAYAMGLINGLLPCGMVYIALISTLSFTSMGDSIGFMAMFGAGTIPLMMLVGFAGQVIKPSVKRHMQKAVPWAVVLVGVMLVLRGLDLGIPFISPALPQNPGEVVVCH